MSELNLPQCPLPLSDYPTVQLAHGGGGKLMHTLISKMFHVALDNRLLSSAHDSALLPQSDGRLAFTTDSFVVKPLFFNGGDIGRLAVYGTVNDLAMAGARPAYLSLALILEEGFSMQELWRIICSIAQASKRCDVPIVTGDTKVVERGKGDGVYINTSGVGLIETDVVIAPAQIQAGAVIIVSGDVGRHGIAIMAEREGIEFQTPLASDCAPLWEPVKALLAADVAVHCLRDVTRGGVATVCVELADQSDTTFELTESCIDVATEVGSACELLGFDPLHVASEGRFVAVVSDADSEKALSALRSQAVSAEAGIIGVVRERGAAPAVLRNEYGGARILDMLSGEQLPRIC